NFRRPQIAIRPTLINVIQDDRLRLRELHLHVVVFIRARESERLARLIERDEVSHGSPLPPRRIHLREIAPWRSGWSGLPTLTFRTTLGAELPIVRATVGARPRSGCPQGDPM